MVMWAGVEGRNVSILPWTCPAGFHGFYICLSKMYKLSQNSYAMMKSCPACQSMFPSVQLVGSFSLDTPFILHLLLHLSWGCTLSLDFCVLTSVFFFFLYVAQNFIGEGRSRKSSKCSILAKCHFWSLILHEQFEWKHSWEFQFMWNFLHLALASAFCAGM